MVAVVLIEAIPDAKYRLDRSSKLSTSSGPKALYGMTRNILAKTKPEYVNANQTLTLYLFKLDGGDSNRLSIRAYANEPI